MTATLIAAVIIGQLGITVTGPLKPFFFLMFLFAIGYAVGPQFVRGIAKDGLPQALYAAVVCVFCLSVRLPGRPSWPATTWVPPWGSMRVRRPSRHRWASALTRSTALGCRRSETKNLLDAMPVAYAVTYIFGTVGSAVIIALARPRLARHRSRRGLQAVRGKARGQEGGRWRRHGLASVRFARLPRSRGRSDRRHDSRRGRAFGSRTARLYSARSSRRGRLDATSDTVIQSGDIVAVAGRRDVLTDLIGKAAEEVDDRDLLAVPIEGVDVYVTNKKVDGREAGRLGHEIPGLAASTCARSREARPRPTSRSCPTRRSIGATS